MTHPFTTVSLWAVLQIDAPTVLNAFSYLGSSIKHLEMGREEIIAGGDCKLVHIQVEQCADLMQIGKVLGETAAALDMVAAKAAAQRFGEKLDAIGKQAGRLTSNDLGRLPPWVRRCWRRSAMKWRLA